MPHSSVAPFSRLTLKEKEALSPSTLLEGECLPCLLTFPGSNLSAPNSQLLPSEMERALGSESEDASASLAFATCLYSAVMLTGVCKDRLYGAWDVREAGCGDASRLCWKRTSRPLARQRMFILAYFTRVQIYMQIYTF